MRTRRLRILIVVPLVLLLGLLSGPAFGSPLRATTARAFGASIDLLGAGLLPPTPNVTAGPGPNTGSNNLLTVPLGTLVSAGAASAKARTTLNSEITPEIPTGNLRVFSPGGAPLPGTFNGQAYARVAGAVIAASDTVGLPPDVAALFGLGTVLSADAVQSEALVSCVNGSAVIVAGSQLAGVTLLGIDLTNLVDGTLNQVIPLADTVVGLLGGRAIANEVVNSGSDNVSINALHVTLPNILDVTLAHAEVTGASCGPAPQCSNGIDDDGDGKIDIADPECHTDGNADNPASFDPNDDSEAGLLPRTGGTSLWLGVSLLGLGALMLAFTNRMKRANS
ncbi:MAG: hypothetical protein ACT4OM_08675 [Actinomycetota bacterium]